MSEDPFGLFDFDGVFGLGLVPLSLTPTFHFLEQMTENRPQMSKQFALFLTDDGVDYAGQITFGGYDPEKALTEPKWAPLAREDMGYWQVEIKSVRVGDTYLDVCSGGCHAILDTGSSMLGVPQAHISSVHKLLARPVPDELYDTQDCRTVPAPDLIFDMGGFELTMGYEDLSKPAVWNVTRDTVDENGTEVTDWKLWCRHMLLPTNLKPPLGPNTFIFGAPVLQKHYTVFDVGDKRLGFTIANRSPRNIQQPQETGPEIPTITQSPTDNQVSQRTNTLMGNRAVYIV